MLLALLVALSQDGAPAAPSHLGAWHHTVHGLDRPLAVAFDPAGRVWVAESGAGTVRAFEADGRPGPVLEAAAERPQGIALAGDGTVWISDGARHQLVAWDPATGAEVARLGVRGPGEGELLDPAGLAWAPGRLAVADRGNRRAQVFDLATGRARAIALDARAAPVDVAWDGDELLVLDADRHLVQRVGAAETPEGRIGGTLGAFGFPPGLFATPGGCALADGRLFVADTENHRVQVFDAGLVRAGVPPLRQAPDYVLGSHAIRPREGRGKMHYPSDVAVSRDGRWLALCEPLDDRVQLFERAPGERPPPDPLRSSGGQASAHYGTAMDVDGRCLAVVQPETQSVLVFDLRQLDPERRNDPLQVSVFGGLGDRLGQFVRPTGLDLDLGHGNRMWIGDGALRRIQEFELRFDPTAELAQDFEMARAVRGLDFARLGEDFAGVALEWIPEPAAVRASPTGEVVVLDAANQRVLVLGPDLAPRRSFGGFGREPGRLRGARDLALDAAGVRAFVVERDNARVQVLSLEDGASLAFLGAGVLDEPAAVALDTTGRAWVTDEGTNEVLSFAPDGTLLARHGGVGLSRDALYRPRGLGLSGDGELFVIDHANHRGMVLAPDLDYVHAFGSRLYTRPARDPDQYPPGSEQE